jgi:hypothetical protein
MTMSGDVVLTGLLYALANGCKRRLAAGRARSNDRPELPHLRHSLTAAQPPQLGGYATFPIFPADLLKQTFARWRRGAGP